MTSAKQSNCFSELCSSPQMKSASFCLTCACKGTEFHMYRIENLIFSQSTLCQNFNSIPIAKGKSNFFFSWRWHALTSSIDNCGFHTCIHYCTNCLNFPFTF